MVAIVHGTCSNSWRTIWLLSTRDNISSCLIQGHAWHWVRKAAKRRSSSAKAGWSESTSESTLNHKPSPCPTWTGHNKSKRKDIPAKVQLTHDMFAVGSFEVFLPKVSYLLYIPANCHACRSKTWISRLLMPVFRFVTPGRKVWAITALTDTFWKIY